MKDLFEGFEAEFNELDPQVQVMAMELAKKLMATKGYSKKTALKQAIKDAEQLFFDLEG